mmetsp:Transcript_33356/g.50322  ORF Transcript_33356/g.50322 Transcript_33356/m.50322 type:complete len:224 (-) Transcript_33356:899-1570(-)
MMSSKRYLFKKLTMSCSRRSISPCLHLLLLVMQLNVASSVHSNNPHYFARLLGITKPNSLTSKHRLSSTKSKREEDFSTPYSSNIPFEILPLEEVLNYLAPKEVVGGNSDHPLHLQKGLSNQAQTRLSEIGPNALQPQRKKSIWELWLQQFDDTLVKILVGVALASTAFSLSEVRDKLQRTMKTPLNPANPTNYLAEAFSLSPGLKSTILESIVEPSIIIRYY